MRKTTTTPPAKTPPARRTKSPAASPLPPGPAPTVDPAIGPATPGDAGPQVTPALHRRRKGALVLALLGRPEGASTAELMEATGWLPHSVRAAISTLRKDGIVITRTGRGETMRYVLRDKP